MKYAISLALCALGLSSPALAAASDVACPGFQAGSTSTTDLDRFYGMRAVEIVRAARQGDMAQLIGLVSPQFAFEIWRGDASFVPRTKGADAAVEMATSLGVSSYQIFSAISGPIGIASPPERCLWSAKIMWRSADEGLGVSMTFDFEEGRLIRAIGHSVTILEGSLI